MSRPFIAQYPGLCNACGGQIVPEQLATYGPDGIEHVFCPDPAPSRPVCPTCFTELPLTGVCGVCG